MSAPSDALAAQLGECLRQRGWVLATAESCTGGLVSGAVTAIAGSSSWFDRGFVTYANAAKTAVLGVEDDLLCAEGAVSEAVARAMAWGALRNSEATAALAVTGIAGPGGGSADKPVGTVCFAWVWPQGCRLACESTTLVFAGDRAAVRQQSVAEALSGMLARCG